VSFIHQMIHKKQKNVIPGFGLSMGITITMLSLVVLIPLGSVLIVLGNYTFAQVWQMVTSSQALASYRVTLSTSFVASIVNVVFGILLAWILTRYRFPGRRILDGLIELPFAMPTAVSGLALTVLYSENGWIGAILTRMGIDIAFTPSGITMALIFIGIPFVVRSIQPVIEELHPQYEEAASILGASKTRIFFQVVLPEMLPAVITGFGLAFARSIGEFGSVVFIAGNIPYETQVTSLIIMNHLDQFNFLGATSIALVMIIFSFLVLFGLNVLQAKVHKMAREA